MRYCAFMQLYHLKQENRKLLKSSQSWYRKYEQLHSDTDKQHMSHHTHSMMLENEFTDHDIHFGN